MLPEEATGRDEYRKQRSETFFTRRNLKKVWDAVGSDQLMLQKFGEISDATKLEAVAKIQGIWPSLPEHFAIEAFFRAHRRFWSK
jgi:hypothetical protein